MSSYRIIRKRFRPKGRNDGIDRSDIDGLLKSAWLPLKTAELSRVEINSSFHEEVCFSDIDGLLKSAWLPLKTAELSRVEINSSFHEEVCFFVFVKLLLTQLPDTEILPSIETCLACASAEEVREVRFIILTKLKYISSEVRFVWRCFVMEDTLHGEVIFVFFVTTHRADIYFTRTVL